MAGCPRRMGTRAGGRTARRRGPLRARSGSRGRGRPDSSPRGLSPGRGARRPRGHLSRQACPAPLGGRTVRPGPRRVAAARGAGAAQCRDAGGPGARLPQDGRPRHGPPRVPSRALARARPWRGPPGRGQARPAMSAVLDHLMAAIPEEQERFEALCRDVADWVALVESAGREGVLGIVRREILLARVPVPEPARRLLERLEAVERLWQANVARALDQALLALDSRGVQTVALKG